MTVAMIKKKINLGTLVTVFLPTTPNPTSGFMLFVPKSDVILLNIRTLNDFRLLIQPKIKRDKQNKVEILDTEDTVKEFKLDTELHTNPNYNQLLNTEGKLASLKVDKPDNETWFMVHPEHQVELYILEASQKGNLK